MAGRGGRKALPSTAPPSLSSQATTPVPIANRLDLLLSEQTTLCKNAHEGLHQSLAVLQKASSKEEQESARLQVQSLMMRAEELVMTLQVIVEIRRELAHVQKGFLEAKKEQQEIGKLQGRLQWLEQRLEKTLLARRRGRPAARRRRNIPGQVPVAYRTDQFQEPMGEQPSHQKPARPRPTKSNMYKKDRKAVTVLRPAIVTSTSKTSDILESPSRPSTRFSASQPTQARSIGPQVSNVRLDSFAVSQIQQRSESPYSSRTFKDSDAWHSESEANWTTVEACSNPLKDISQQLSSGDDDQKVNKVEAAESVGGSEATKCSSAVLAYSYSFETPRPVEVFGPCSWNSLCLAMNTNQLQQGSTRKASSPVRSELDAAMLQAGLDSVYSDLEALRQLIITAARVATETGLSLPPGNLAYRQSPAANVISTQRKKLESADKAENFLKLPILDDVSSSPVLPPVRKIYGKKAQSHHYPRTSHTWYDHTTDTLEGTHALENTDVDKVKNHDSDLDWPLAMRSILPKKKLKSARVGSDKLSPGDVFNRAGHQSVHLKRLLIDVDSPLIEVQRDSVQALGALTGSSTAVQEKLHTKMLHSTDPTVRYESLKSLLHLGVVDALVLKFSAYCLAEGSPQLQLDLLQFLCKKNNLSQVKGESAWVKLSEVLRRLLVSGDFHISLLASVLLSRKQLEKDCCMTKLKAALDHPDPQYQSMALVHLVKCWQYNADKIVHCAIEQMCKLYNWQLRLAAIKTLENIGSEVLFNKVGRQNLFDMLLDRLVNEPMQVVRSSIGNLLSEFGLDKKARSMLMGRLESSDEVIRAEAAIALGAFEVKSHKSLQMLLDCLELDPSTFVRVQVIRLLGQMKSHNPVVIHHLQAKCRGQGIIARESRSALQKLAWVRCSLIPSLHSQLFFACCEKKLGVETGNEASVCTKKNDYQSTV